MLLLRTTVAVTLFVSQLGLAAFVVGMIDSKPIRSEFDIVFAVSAVAIYSSVLATVLILRPNAVALVLCVILGVAASIATSLGLPRSAGDELLFGSVILFCSLWQIVGGIVLLRSMGRAKSRVA